MKLTIRATKPLSGMMWQIIEAIVKDAIKAAGISGVDVRLEGAK
jgi:hypothetical protein